MLNKTDLPTINKEAYNTQKSDLTDKMFLISPKSLIYFKTLGNSVLFRESHDRIKGILVNLLKQTKLNGHLTPLQRQTVIKKG